VYKNVRASCTLNVKIFTGGRLTQAAAKRGFLPAILSTIAEGESRPGADFWEDENSSRLPKFLRRPMRYGDGSVPLSAIVFNAILAAIYIMCGEFGILIIFIGIVEYSVAFVTILGLVNLRLQNRGVNRNIAQSIFRVPWLLILVASTATVVMVLISVIRHPLIGVGYLISCAASTYIFVHFIRP